MATVPSTLVIYTNDKINLPTKMLHIIVKQIFQYGVKSITVKGDRIMMTLNYTPKGSTLIKKFGNLPVKYMKVNVETSEEFDILEKAVKKFKFNMLEEEEEEQEVNKMAIEQNQQQQLPIENESQQMNL